jgi:purine-binding chemotaxis protein CheW
MVSSSVAAAAGPDAPSLPQWVIVACGGRRFGFPLQCVTEILSPRPFTRLPGTGLEVCGLIGVRGRIVTVFDLGIIVGGRPAAVQTDHRLLLLEVGRRRVAVAAEDVLAIEGAALLSEAEDDSRAAGAVLGTGEAEAGPFTALDPGALLETLLQ